MEHSNGDICFGTQDLVIAIFHPATEEGTGLGLAITKQLVELIQVSSTPGSGSVFSFSLPYNPACLLERQTAQEPQEAFTSAVATPPTAQPTRTGPKLLVVDDDPVNRMVISRLLSRETYQLIEAQSGEEALQLLAQHSDIALIILDVMMPQLSGYDTCRLLRQQHTVEHLPVIFLTAKDLGDDWVRGYLIGGNDFLTKPVSKQLLLARVVLQLALVNGGRPAPNNAEQRALSLLQPLLPALAHPQGQGLPQALLTHTQAAIDGTQSLSCWLLSKGKLVCCANSAGSSGQIISDPQRLTGIEGFLLNIEQTRGSAYLSTQEQALLMTQDLFAHGQAPLIVVPGYFEDLLLGFIAITTTSKPNPETLAQLKLVKPLLVATLKRLRETLH